MEISANTTTVSEASPWRREQPEQSVANKLAEERLDLEDEIRTENTFEAIIGESPALKCVLKQVEIVTSHRFHSSAFGRDWDRQGTNCAGYSQSEFTPQTDLGESKLRRHPPRACSKVNCSGTRKARLQAPLLDASAVSSWPTAVLP